MSKTKSLRSDEDEGFIYSLYVTHTTGVAINLTLVDAVFGVGRYMYMSVCQENQY